MRRLLILLLVLFPSLVSAQGTLRAAGAPGSWVAASEKGCIGGSTCRDRQLRVSLQDRPVVAVRFRAHDQIGNKAEGALRVKIDGNTVESYIDIPRRGDLFTLDIEELRGRWLVFEAAANDEVEISDIAVLYATDTMRIPRDRNRGRWDDRPGRGSGATGPGWRPYRDADGCIGGDECRKNGRRITVALADRPVLGIRFHAHDSVGQRADGKLTVRIDDETIASYVDVQRNGRVHEFDVDEMYGSKLVIEAANDDEVEISDLEILYGRAPRGGGRNGGRDGYGATELRDEGGCIGGDECGGRRAEIRIDLRGRPVESIRLYARDDIGTRAGGKLRIRIDDEILEYSLDIPREGRTFTIDGRNIAGDYLIIEPADNDEVMVRDIRVQLRRSY